LSFIIFFHWPIHTFKGWDLKGSAHGTIQGLGLLKLILRTLFINSLLSVVLPQIIFTYVLIYWLLPNYVYKKRQSFIVVGMTIVALSIYFFVAAGFKYLTPVFSYISGLSKRIPPFSLAMQASLRDQVTTLPIVAGFAVMIKLIKRWWLKQKETEQLAREKSKAELQLLKSQIHPHFLFNTLNNIYFFALTNSKQTPEMIKKLSSMLYYILNECDQPVVPLSKEIKMIRNYMSLEKLRYGEQMNMAIETDDNSDNTLIAPLLLIPFVENSFKHGTSKMVGQPWVKLTISIKNNLLLFSIINSRPQTNELASTKGNIGLKNVTKRLQLLYPEAHELNIIEKPESFTVDLKIKLEKTIAYSADEETKTTSSYEMA